MQSYQLPLLPGEVSVKASSGVVTHQSAAGAKANGSANRLAPEDLPAHDWYRFVLSFPPHLVREYLNRFRVNASQVVLDPFCGTGTTLVECKKLGIPSVGIEAHPMAHFAASTKTDWYPDPERLLAHAWRVADVAKAALRRDRIDDLALRQDDGRSMPPLLSLPQDAYRLLLRDSISPIPLHRSLVLLGTLQLGHEPELSSHEKLALAKALVTSIGNLHFGPEVGVGRRKADAPVIAVWLEEVKKIAADLSCLSEKASVPATVILADARSIPESLPPASLDMVFTSPPYPNEKDYTRTTRLESVILGFIKNKTDLRALKKTLVRSNTRGIYRTDDDDVWIADFPNIAKIAENIEVRRKQLGKTSGFERMYHKVTLQYFGGMARHLAALRACLRPGAKLAYVVGDQASYLQVMIRTGELLSQIGRSLGYELIGIDLFRTRLATATRQQLREEVVLLQWPG